MEKGVLRNFTKLTGKHLRQNLFFNKVADYSGRSVFTHFNQRNQNAVFLAFSLFTQFAQFSFKN